MRDITFLFIVLISFFGYTQESKKLRGVIVVDSIQVDAIHVLNQTQNTGVINNQSGSFEIRAIPGDTIIFSSVQYAIQQHIVTQKDLDMGNLVLKLEFLVNQLDEVFVSEHTLTGKIEEDLLKIPTFTENFPLWNAVELKQMGVGTFNDAQSPVQNLVLREANAGQVGTSIDLMELTSSISSIFRKNKDFASKIEKMSFFTEKMITERLEIPETEYYNFIDFMNEQPGIANMLASKDKLKVLEYLINKSVIFKEKYNIQK